MAKSKKGSGAPKASKGMKAVEEGIAKATKPDKPTPPRAVSAFAGKTFVGKVKLEESRRISGSTRYASLRLITEAGAKGISYEEYKAKGGTTRYLGWFLRREQAALKDA